MLGNAGAVVADGRAHAGLVADRRDHDARPGWVVDERVVEQDPHDLGYADRIAKGLDRSRRKPQLEVGVVLREHGLELAVDRPRQLPQVHLLGSELERTRVELGEIDSPTDGGQPPTCAEHPLVPIR